MNDDNLKKLIGMLEDLNKKLDKADLESCKEMEPIQVISTFVELYTDEGFETLLAAVCANFIAKAGRRCHDALRDSEDGIYRHETGFIMVEELNKIAEELHRQSTKNKKIIEKKGG